MNQKIRVMHYYTYPENSGGPLTYIRNVVSSDRFSNVIFGECYQNAPISKLRPAMFRKIVAEIKRFSPDILHVHGVQSEGFVGVLAGKRAKVPSVLLTVHGLQQDAQSIGKIKRFLFERAIEPFALRESDAVYCVCDAMTNRAYIQKYAKGLKSTIHCFLPDKKDYKVQKKPHDGISFIYVGRISLDKGMKELEECIMLDQAEDHRYIIVGSGEYEGQMGANLKAQIDSGRVNMMGQRSDVVALLELADVFIFPSHHENLSIALLEACSAGLACIVTGVGGNTEVIRDGIDGLVIQAKDPQGMLEAIRRLTSNGLSEIRNYGQRASARIDEVFSEEIVVRKISALYGELARNCTQ